MDTPIKVAYAREGATIINAYEPGNQPTRLKRRKIRGVESYSMACSERELGISDEHEGIIFLDATPCPARPWSITWGMRFTISPSPPISPAMPISWG